jgi:hypothetical protein
LQQQQQQQLSDGKARSRTSLQPAAGHGLHDRQLQLPPGGNALAPAAPAGAGAEQSMQHAANPVRERPAMLIDMADSQP